MYALTRNFGTSYEAFSRGYFFANIMTLFKKGYNLKVLLVIIGMTFLCHAVLYPSPLLKDSLRVHIGFEAQDQDGAPDDTLPRMLEVMNGDGKQEELWPELKKAVNRFKNILDGNTSEYGASQKYFERETIDYSPSLVKFEFPAPTVTISPQFYRSMSIEVEAGIFYMPTVSFSQDECVVAYALEGEASVIDFNTFKTINAGPCFVAYFLAVQPEDEGKKILLAFHLPIEPHERVDLYKQLFLFVRALMDTYGIKDGAITSAFYGNKNIKDKDKGRIKGDFYGIFPEAILNDEAWGSEWYTVEAGIEDNNLKLTAENKDTIISGKPHYIELLPTISRKGYKSNVMSCI